MAEVKDYGHVWAKKHYPGSSRVAVTVRVQPTTKLTRTPVAIANLHVLMITVILVFNSSRSHVNAHAK